MTEAAGLFESIKQRWEQRRHKASRTDKQSAGTDAAVSASGASAAAPRPNQVPDITEAMSHCDWEDHAAMAQTELGPDGQQRQEPNQPLQEVPQYVQLNYQLLVTQMERQRVRQELDTLSCRHSALTSQCIQLGQLVQAAKAAERGSSSSSTSSSNTVSAVNKQLERLQQQLAEATGFMAQQQNDNQAQQEQQLQQALSCLAAERQKAAAFQQELQQTQQAWTASRQQEQVLWVQVQELSAAGLKKNSALAAAMVRAVVTEQRAADLAAKASTRHHQQQQELAAIKQQYQQLQQEKVDVSRALVLLTKQKEEAVAAAQHYKAQAAAANAARQTAWRDAAASLAAATHFEGELLAARVEFEALNRQLAAAKAEPEELKRMLRDAAELMGTMPEEIMMLHQEAQQLVQRAELAESQVTITKLNCRDVIKEKDQDYAQLKVELRQVTEALVYACDDRYDLLEEVDLLKRALQHFPESKQLLKALRHTKGPVPVPQAGKGRSGWWWGWVSRKGQSRAAGDVPGQGAKHDLSTTAADGLSYVASGAP